MSLDTTGIRAASPASSGRASPVIRFRPQRGEDASQNKDKAYRRYALAVERALGSFDTTQQEWADYISFLNRLLKALQTHPPNNNAVPDSQMVATRLAQCLKPSLPSGVHQKALEVFAYLFSVLGPSVLARDFHIYFPGLASVLSFASLGVRPLFLSLLEEYILPLDANALRTALKSIILCLLPGLEDETSEDFDRVVHVLDRLRSAPEKEDAKVHRRDLSGISNSHDSFFWQCFFLATITNPSRRHGSLSYLNRHLPKFGTKQATNVEDALKTLSFEARAALSPEPGLLIRCFAAGLADKQPLVQRGFLDLLVTNIPLDSAVLQDVVPPADLDRLIFAAVGVVARRDMSLNRRLWSWFLGPEPKLAAEKPNTTKDSSIVSPTVDSSQFHAAYFARYGLRALTRSVMSLLEEDVPGAAERARPFRICLSLMDRWEVGGLLIPDIFIPAISNIFRYTQTAAKQDADDVLRSASNFFDGVESGLIWAKVTELMNDALSPDTSSPDRMIKLKVLGFIVHHFNLKEEEMILYHIPLTVLFILLLVERQSSVSLQSQEEELIFEILDKLTINIPARAFTQTTGSTAEAVTLSPPQLVDAVQHFYSTEQGTLEGEGFPISPVIMATELLRVSIRLFVKMLNAQSSEEGAPSVSTFDSVSKVVCAIVRTVPQPTGSIRESMVFDVFLDRLQSEEEDTTSGFAVISAITAIFATVSQVTLKDPVVTLAMATSLQDLLVRRLWRHLDPEIPKYHVEAVRNMWQLEMMTAVEKGVEASITALMLQRPELAKTSPGSRYCDSGRRFAILWAHSVQEKVPGGEKTQRSLLRKVSAIHPHATQATFPDAATALRRPLLVLLDWLEDDGTERAAFVATWLQQLPSLANVFEILVNGVRSLQCMRASKSSVRTAGKTDDRPQCLFYLKHLLRILQGASEHTWIVLARDMVEPFSTISKLHSAEPIVLQALLIQICFQVLVVSSTPGSDDSAIQDELERLAVELLQLIIEGPFSAPLKDLELENQLIQTMNERLEQMTPSLQLTYLHTISATLKLRTRSQSAGPISAHQRRFSRDVTPTASQTTLHRDSITKDTDPSTVPPAGLVECIKVGFALPQNRIILDDWVAFLRDSLPLLLDTLFQHLIPLVEIFCFQIGKGFEDLRSLFQRNTIQLQTSPEPTIVILFNGLEQVLATAHDKLLSEETKKPTAKTPEQPQGFFGNVTNMTQGLFVSEPEKHTTRTTTANDRLAILLCFQDSLRCCFRVWTWGVHGHDSDKQDHSSQASFAYTSLRLRKRALKVLENLFAAEALECLEQLAVLFCHPLSDEYQPLHVLELLNVLNGSRPKYTAPAIFNSIYRRINVDTGRESIRTSDLSAADLVHFLIEYIRSIEDDAMDEIWNDCLAFLRDILNNPLDYSQVLPLLLSFVALIAQKVDNTNFGEQRKMRKDLGEVFLRLLTATFTALGPAGFLQTSGQASSSQKGRTALNGTASESQNFALTLASVVAKLPIILYDNERIGTATTAISTNVIGPAIRGKAFPRNIDQPFLELVVQVTRTAQGTKAWRKDVTDALNDSKFFHINVDLAFDYLCPIARQLALHDKERLPELLSRLNAPTTAGIVFGVGATSARIDADQKTQLNLRRIAFFILACDEDAFSDRYRILEEKIVELLTATPTSSPSSNTRAEVFMVLRALVLRSSSIYLSPFWPLIISEVQNAILSVLPKSPDSDNYNNASVLQACKLLDLLVTLDLDDFQLHEWLFITDTIDAVYRPAHMHSTALADEVAEAIGTSSPVVAGSTIEPSKSRSSFLGPLLEGLEDLEPSEVKVLPKSELATRVLQPFFGQLGLWAFEARYADVGVDVRGAEKALICDLFEEGEA